MKLIYLLANILFFLNSQAQLANSSTSGTASFYASKFEGRKCSSGEIFRQDSLTAAHKTLAFGTYVKVTNLANDSVVIVKINDRLPKKSKRIIDLSRRAALQLNFIPQGLAKVRLEALEKEN